MARSVPNGPQLVCALFPYRIDDALEYQALSYCWGKGGFTERIWCSLNECFLPITAELLRILKAFWVCEELHKPKWILVDQICINQQDEAEKGTQIALMGEIYRRAEMVTIWVGFERKRRKACRTRSSGYEPVDCEMRKGYQRRTRRAGDCLE